jgi:hypothetical protein
MSNGKPPYYETVLKIQRYLYSQVDKNILTKIYDEGTKIAAFNISEADFPNLTFITNNPTYNEDPIGLISIDVYLIQNGVLSQVPVQIDGLFEIINGIMHDADSAAFINGSSTNQPFINGIGLGGDTIGETVDNLSQYSPYSPVTVGIPKIFTIKLYGATRSPLPGMGAALGTGANSVVGNGGAPVVYSPAATGSNNNPTASSWTFS